MTRSLFVILLFLALSGLAACGEDSAEKTESDDDLVDDDDAGDDDLDDDFLNDDIGDDDSTDDDAIDDDSGDDDTTDDDTADDDTFDDDTTDDDTGDDDVTIEKKVLAFYYAWYRTPDYSGYWSHWSGEGHDPNNFVSPGRRDIAAIHYPLNGPYDSLDPAVIDRHLQEAAGAGIQGWILSWWGDNTELDAILDRIEQTSAAMQVTIYYELIPGCSTIFCTELTRQEKIDAATAQINALLDEYGDHPAWLKVDDVPVIFIYGRAMTHGFGVWGRIKRLLQQQRPVFLSGDAALTQLWWTVPRAFDQVHYYNPTTQMYYLGEWSLLLAPYVENVRARGQSVAITAIPGYDDSALPSRIPIIIDREDGALYLEQWEDARAAEPDWILVTSYSEWHEGTEIEPSVEFGDAYLQRTAEQAALFLAE